MYEGAFGDFQTILQDEWGITHKTADKPVIGTYGVFPCTGLVIYSDEVVVLGHLASKETMTETMPSVFEKLAESFDNQNYQAYLFGSMTYKSSVDHMSSLINNNGKNLTFEISSEGIRKYANLAVDSKDLSFYVWAPKDNPHLRDLPPKKFVLSDKSWEKPGTLVYDALS
ncbi:MAG: hypothetical protein GOU98_04380, partial [Candidatus Altiarchaeota archaeon]|nr:hypothetical protein [Candidatus Altiarchaeota archaeon]